MTALELEAQYFKDSVFMLGKDVAVRIEADTDLPFWSFVFEKIVPHVKPEFYFQCYEHPSAGTTGKKCVMLLKTFADKELVLCVDSDFDYLLENSDLQQKFIFQTYTHSFENYHCYAPSLSKVIQKAANTEGVEFDFGSILSEKSKKIYPSLLQILELKKSREKCHFS